MNPIERPARLFSRAFIRSAAGALLAAAACVASPALSYFEKAERGGHFAA